MQVSVENVGKLGRKLTVKFPAERLETQVSERIAEMGRTVRLKGFRPGKVPTNVIKQRFGAQVRGEALSDLIGSTLREAFTQEKLQPIANPSVDTTGNAENGEIAYTATFEVMPEFPAIDVAALEISRPKAEVTDADIDKMIETLRTQRRSFDEVSRASKEGDFVMFEYSAEAGDYRFPAEGLERAGSVLGSGTLFKALDDALTGRTAGDDLVQDVAFPEDFRNPDLAGKTAKVTLKIVKVQEPNLPAVDADFVKMFGVADGDIETFRKEVRANLERELKATVMARLKSEVAEKLAGAFPDLDVPELMANAEAQSLAAGNLPRGQQPSPEMVAEALPFARKRVIAALLMGEIARKNELRLDRKRTGDMLAAIASTYEEPEKVIELYNSDPQLMQGLQNRVMEDQVAEWVADNAKTTDQNLSFDEVMRPIGA
ncbi:MULTISPECIES: trigger factor [unclassified Luteibacter]|uniref:trigger factor n=1 Tax=unclassified Luteibacter TaxID=2620188 RepID=UPI0008B7CC97|nr:MULTISPECIES: trigger factor [unclassified Luteibacter]MDR6935182.1 trigger factor [Luteibacter sp. 3190]SEO79190.1 trigger factor [Luteibacter sp. UNC138MFCol5.1]SEV98363.1 trigger factor [Luteibacter sp. 329MFSha]